MNYTVINEVIILSLIMTVGVFARKKNILKSESSVYLSNLLIKITLPLMLLSSFNYNYSVRMVEEARHIFLYSIVVNLAVMLLSKFVTFKYNRSSSEIIRFAMVFSNSGFMGYPVLAGLFGNVGIFYGAVFNIPLNVIMFSLGVMLYSREKTSMASVVKMSLNPAVVATIAGFIMFMFSIKLPTVLKDSISTVGAMTTPLSMIIVGTMLAEVKFKDIFRGKIVYYICFLRLILVPAIAFIILKLIRADNLMLQITVVIEAMPVAVLSPILAKAYRADEKLASKSVFITTMVSMVTIPMVVLIMQYLNSIF